MSVTLTLMRRRPIFLSSPPRCGRRLQELIPVGVDLLDVHSGDDQAELAEDDVLGQLLDLLELQPSRRSAAFCMTPGSVETPTVKRLGTLMRMFWRDKAFSRSTEMDMGVRSRNS